MTPEQAAAALEALGNTTRLHLFRLLITTGEAGLPVADIQDHLSIPPSTLSHHMARLVRVGLVSQERRSRQLICRAEYQTMDELLGFLTNNCCAGLPGQSRMDAS